MTPHWFFFSYARLDRDPYLKKFYNALVDAVRMQVGGTREEVGFLDAEDIGLGQEWPPALAQGLQTARVLVSVYTPTYFESEFCGKEWTVFEQRRAVTAGPRPPVILPVLWVGEDKLPAALPQAVTDLQHSHGQLGDLYVKEGLWQLMKLSKYRDARLELIDRLADRIIEVGKQHALPPLPGLPPLQKVQSAFHSRPTIPAVAAPNPAHVGPRYVQFLFVAGRRNEFELQKLRKKVECYGTEGGLDWQPFLPGLSKEIAILAMEVAASENLRYEAVPLDEGLIQRLEAAEQANKIVAIIVDTWTLRLEQYHKFMREYDKRSYQNCVVLIPWNLDDEETRLTEQILKDAVELTFVNRVVSKDPNSFIDNIRRPDDLKTSLAAALNTARMRILNIAEVKKRAESQQVIARPVLQN